MFIGVILIILGVIIWPVMGWILIFKTPEWPPDKAHRFGTIYMIVLAAWIVLTMVWRILA